MTVGMEKFFDLPPLDEVLKANGIDVETDDGNNIVSQRSSLEGNDHSESMESLHEEIVQHARDLMAYGYNIDMPRQRGIFEIAASMYGHAMAAKVSKRDAQLKSIKLALDSRKVDLEEKRTNHIIGQTQAATIDGNGTIVVEDRNELLKKLREQIKAQGELS